MFSIASHDHIILVNTLDLLASGSVSGTSYGKPVLISYKAKAGCFESIIEAFTVYVATSTSRVQCAFVVLLKILINPSHV